MLKVDEIAPNFQAKNQNSEDFDLYQSLVRGPIVLYFYPKDNTRVCTKQACALRDMYEEFEEKGVKVVGISIDDQASHEGFAERHNLPFDLIDDSSKAISKAFGVLRIFGIFTKRVTFVIDQERKIRSVLHFELDVDAHLSGIRKAIATF